MFGSSQLVTRHPTGHPGVYHVEPVLSEREFTHWLTLDQRQIPQGQDDIDERVAAHDAALLQEFFATLAERIAFWTEVLHDRRANDKARVRGRDPLLGANGVTVGTGQIAAYVERLEWVERRKDNPEFLALNGHHRFWFVAIALGYGIDSATRYLDGSAAHWGDDELQAGIDAFKELEFLIYRQRGSAVEFLPDRDLAVDVDGCLGTGVRHGGEER